MVDPNIGVAWIKKALENQILAPQAPGSLILAGEIFKTEIQESQ